MILELLIIFNNGLKKVIIIQNKNYILFQYTVQTVKGLLVNILLL